MAVPAIRPKTVRVKSSISQAPLAKSFQAGASGAAPYSSSDNMSRAQNQSTIYRPLAKVVSKATVSLLANMQGNSDIAHQQALSQADVSAQQDKHWLFSNQHPSNLSMVELSQSIEPPTISQQMLDGEPTMLTSSTASADRPSYDGYNWRKYGQKQVKGSEYPRSYYKCTHPNCLVKKKVERSLDGQITEIVYKGEHNHPKPDHAKRSSSLSGVQEVELPTAGPDQDLNSNAHKLCDDICDNNVGFERQMEIQNADPFSKKSMLTEEFTLSCNDHIESEKHNADDMIIEVSAGLGGGCEESVKGLKVHDDDGTKRKRRKQENQNNAAGKSSKGVHEPQISVHNNTEPEIMGDGFRWRKYGQKVVKGNSYPRSYYRCTNLKCNVRKHVERALDDPTTFITTYEGRHNHEMPVKMMNNSSAAEPET
ncbi:probable WRKY transcription factor 3 isoform X3 [Beta vulgaris subsp. vulgaris]|nr:probable WRKY transcription factor 3 isoform X3 [Beta vulgaris subsp. vulgaris]XP_048502576.1 probable WRKY transcription factor 3 isoform X3 [Beta vulgaris subsp. vulgaris]